MSGKKCGQAELTDERWREIERRLQIQRAFAEGRQRVAMLGAEQRAIMVACNQSIASVEMALAEAGGDADERLQPQRQALDAAKFALDAQSRACDGVLETLRAAASGPENPATRAGVDDLVDAALAEIARLRAQATALEQAAEGVVGGIDGAILEALREQHAAGKRRNAIDDLEQEVAAATTATFGALSWFPDEAAALRVRVAEARTSGVALDELRAALDELRGRAEEMDRRDAANRETAEIFQRAMAELEYSSTITETHHVIAQVHERSRASVRATFDPREDRLVFDMQGPQRVGADYCELGDHADLSAIVAKAAELGLNIKKVWLGSPDDPGQEIELPEVETPRSKSRSQEQVREMERRR